MVGQVTVVAILLIVEGALELLVAFILLIGGPAMMLEFEQQSAEVPPAVVGAIVTIFGVVALAAAVLKIVAGIRNLKYRGRTLGIVALVSGVLTMFTCYCAPTALALMVYGLIVYLNGDVARAFEQGKQGWSSDQIKASFLARPRQGPPPPPTQQVAQAGETARPTTSCPACSETIWADAKRCPFCGKVLG
jgi:hypothetical protein